MALTFPPGHTWEDYKIELLDKGRAVIDDIADARRPRFQHQIYGKGNFSFELALDSLHATQITAGEVQYVRVTRGTEHVFDGRIEKKGRKFNQDTKYIEVWEISGVALGMILDDRGGVPITGDSLKSGSLPVDDAFKWIVERTLGATAPASPDANSRVMDGVAVAADKSESGTSIELDATGYSVHQLLESHGAENDVDFDLYFSGTTPYGITYQTWSPRRGLDKSRGNGARREVIFDTEGENVMDASVYFDGYGQRSTLIDRTFTSESTNTTAVTNQLYRERISASGDAATLATQQAGTDIKEGYTFTFRETLGLQWRTHFELGDLVTFSSDYLDITETDQLVSGIEVQIDEDGLETIKVTLGDAEPDMLSTINSAGQSGTKDSLDYPTYTIWGLRDDAGVLGVAATDNTMVIEGGTGITVTKDTEAFGAITYDSMLIDSVWTRTSGSSPEVVSPATFADYVRVTRLEIASAADYIDISGSLFVHADGNLRLDGDRVYLQVAGATKWQVNTAGDLLPDATATYNVGANTKRPSTVYGVAGNFSGDVTINTANKGLVTTDAMTDGFVLRFNGTRGVPAAIAIGDLPAGFVLWTLTGDVLTTNPAGGKVSLTDTLTVTGADIEVYA